jgi:hypothetical protein
MAAMLRRSLYSRWTRPRLSRPPRPHGHDRARVHRKVMCLALSLHAVVNDWWVQAAQRQLSIKSYRNHTSDGRIIPEQGLRRDLAASPFWGAAVSWAMAFAWRHEAATSKNLIRCLEPMATAYQTQSRLSRRASRRVKLSSPSGSLPPKRGSSLPNKRILRDFSVYYQPVNLRPRITEISVGEDPLSRLGQRVSSRA